MQPTQVLKKHFGYKNFRPGQLEIIENILQKKDCLAILPTGGGKSICFQVPGLLLTGVTVVISPLISLMKDQVDTLNKKEISACYINGLLSKKELANTYQLLRLEKFKFVYIAPERLHSKLFQSVVSKLKVTLLVIDEAHCINQWGDTFRPSYKKIIEQKKNFLSDCPVVAFTATANQKAQADIIKSLELKNPFIYYNSFKRTNLHIEVIECHNRTIKNLILLRLLTKHQFQAGIIYCSTRKTTQEVAIYLKKFGFNTQYYHGGLEKTEKQDVQLAFVTGHTKIIVATNAFGMGIDVSDIRFVIHYQIPGNIENYYQEVGRAGRDQKDSYCYTLFYKKDIKIQYELVKKFSNKVTELKKMVQLLESRNCRTKSIMSYFGEPSDCCNNCDVCSKTSYRSQLLIHITQTEIEKITNIIAVREKSEKLNKRFPLTDTIIAFLVILKPKKRSEFTNIPGIGTGFLEIWYDHIQPIFSK